MSAWGNLPWENDSAADWFGDTFDATKLADHVEAALRLDPDESHEEIRAAAAVLLFLGHTFVWPVNQLDAHLTLAADQLDEILRRNILEEYPDLTASIRAESQELRSRINKADAPSPPPKPPEQQWWQL